MKKKLLNEKESHSTKLITRSSGITLVALIITIIVLLILAVVAIRAVTGDGIIAHAENAKDKYQEKSDEENQTIQNYVDYITEQLGGNNGGGSESVIETITVDKLNTVLSATANTKLLDKYGNKIAVPAGFKILVDSTTNYTAETIDVTKGIVIEDVSAKDASTKGSQFVWIPVGKIYTDTAKTDSLAKTITLGRYSWSGNTGTLAQPIAGDDIKSTTNEVAIVSEDLDNHIELQPTANGKGPNGNAIARNINDFYNGTISNGGYYLGRYEASSSGETIACKANQDVYGDIIQPTASDKSKTMYSDGYATGTYSSDLANSYAWDTAIVFIQTFEKADYASYNKAEETQEFRKAGMSEDKYRNIHDMSGNVVEWTTETCSNADCPCIQRGGYYNTIAGYADGYTCYRFVGTADNLTTGGFRPLLYVGL